MAKYKSFRGKIVDMDQLRRENESAVAGGNMGVNAKGDKLGRGGVVEETAGTRARKHYKASSSTTKKSVSVKDKADEQTVFQDEAPKETKDKKPAAKNTRPARKKNTKKPKETITEAGDIIIEDESESEE